MFLATEEVEVLCCWADNAIILLQRHLTDIIKQIIPVSHPPICLSALFLVFHFPSSYLYFGFENSVCPSNSSCLPFTKNSIVFPPILSSFL